jgi:hypothetical protein
LKLDEVLKRNGLTDDNIGRSTNTIRSGTVRLSETTNQHEDLLKTVQDMEYRKLEVDLQLIIKKRKAN